MTHRLLPSTLLLALALTALAGCQRDAQAPKDTGTPAASTATDAGPQTILGKSVDKALREARRELETGNLSLDDGVDIQVGEHQGGFRIRGDKDTAEAAITPRGDFLLRGKPVEVTAAQRELLLAYRRDVIDVAEAGMAVGVKGADLAGKAIMETLGSLMRGDGDDFDQRMEAEGRRIEAEAMKICEMLPHMLATQDKLAASLPEFKPYAKMTREDIDECGEEVRKSMAGKSGAAFSEADRDALREDIRNGVRDGVRAVVRKDSGSDEAPARDADTAGR